MGRVPLLTREQIKERLMVLENARRKVLDGHIEINRIKFSRKENKIFCNLTMVYIDGGEEKKRTLKAVEYEYNKIAIM